MTPEEREQVVELLRCAADIHATGPTFMPIDDAARETFGEQHHNITTTHPAFDLACNAIYDIDVGPCSVEQLLEVARRVEEGSWP